MTSVDELFKRSGLSSKRKLDPVRDPSELPETGLKDPSRPPKPDPALAEIYKSASLPKGQSSRRARASLAASDTEARADNDDDDDDGDGDYGPAAPVQGEEEEDEDQDEEGRFFGGGISAQEREVLDFIGAADDADAAGDETMDAAWLRRTALQFEKRISRNAELRARHAGEPARFMDSEADLDAAVRALSILGEHPDLWADLVALGCAGSLVGLLSHENSDMAIGVVEILAELTGDDVAASETQWGALVDALLEADLLGLLVGNLARFDETVEADRQGVYHALHLLENLCSRLETAEVVARNEALLAWLLDRVRRPEKEVGPNKQYAAEMVAILVQVSPANRRRLAERDAVDVLLQLVAVYRKRDPDTGGDEEEYMENLFEALTCIVDESEGKAKFVEAEGVELCLIMLREGRASKAASLRLLDHAAGGQGGGQVCQKMVDAGGLKTTFTLFMKKHDGRTSEHLLALFASALRSLPAHSPERIRMLAKFVEKRYEKTERLVKVRREYAAKLAAAEAGIDQERKAASVEEQAERAPEWFSRRLDAGLFCLQTIDVILAWLIAEDDGAGRKIKALLLDQDETVAVLRATVQEQMDGIDLDSAASQETREMLSTLLDFLQ